MLLQRKEHSQRNARENALAAWAGKVVGDPNAIAAGDVHCLRAAGYGAGNLRRDVVCRVSRRIFEVNDALGARPHRQLATSVPSAVRDAVRYGRSVSQQPSTTQGA